MMDKLLWYMNTKCETRGRESWTYTDIKEDDHHLREYCKPDWTTVGGGTLCGNCERVINEVKTNEFLRELLFFIGD